MHTRRLSAIVAAGAAVLVLLRLGVWQVERRAWKHALVAQVDRRLAAAPVTAPGPDRWRAIGAGDAYKRVMVTGRWIGRDTRVQAVTALGGGFWVMRPLVTPSGWVVLVNRGFVPLDSGRRVASSSPSPPRGASGEQRPALFRSGREPDRPAAGRGEGPVPRGEVGLGETSAPLPTLSAKGRGPVIVTGLLRLTEPRGGFLRANDPAAARWYSRDAGAIAAAQGIPAVAPYFIDADRSGPGWPRGGMTVVRFPDNHLVYALTWFALAGLVAFLSIRALRR